MSNFVFESAGPSLLPPCPRAGQATAFKPKPRNQTCTVARAVIAGLQQDRSLRHGGPRNGAADSGVGQVCGRDCERGEGPFCSRCPDRRQARDPVAHVRTPKAEDLCRGVQGGGLQQPCCGGGPRAVPGRVHVDRSCRARVWRKGWRGGLVFPLCSSPPELTGRERERERAESREGRSCCSDSAALWTLCRTSCVCVCV